MELNTGLIQIGSKMDEARAWKQKLPRSDQLPIWTQLYTRERLRPQRIRLKCFTDQRSDKKGNGYSRLVTSAQSMVFWKKDKIIVVFIEGIIYLSCLVVPSGGTVPGDIHKWLQCVKQSLCLKIVLCMVTKCATNGTSTSDNIKISNACNYICQYNL